MRVEKHDGRYILCGDILPYDAVQPGQQWQGSSGFVVTVEKAGEWIEYSWLENGEKKTHTKDNFSFQCRYCLVLSTEEDLK